MSEEMSHERNWEAELEAAAFTDASPEQTPAQPVQETPEGASAPANVQPEPAAEGEPVTPTEPVAPAEPEDTFDGGAFNPDLLPPELQPGWRQLQGAFTRKTQEMAAERQQLQEAIATVGDPGTVAEAMGLYQAIQNPANWAQLHQELTEAMAAQGVTPGAPVTPQPALEPQPAVADVDDPELKPLMDKITELSQRIEGFDAREREQAVQRQQQAEYAARVAEFERQETQIKELYPQYDSKNWDDIYALSTFYGGNLIQAQQHFEASRRGTIEQYLASKASAHEIAPSTPPQGTTAPAQPVSEPLTIRDVEEEAVEHLRKLQAAGELDV